MLHSRAALRGNIFGSRVVSQRETEIVDGHSVFRELVVDAGPSAPWIVMVHGVSQDRRFFSAQVGEFSEHYRLILIDLPGHGLSARAPGPYGLEEFASAIDGVARITASAPFHFWGTHIGAAAGLLLAARHPELFSSLVLEAPVYPGRPLPAVANIIARVATAAREGGMAAAREIWWNDSEWFSVMRSRPRECRSAEQRRIIEDFQGGPWLDQRLTMPIASIGDALAVCKVPTLIMNGEHDLNDFLAVAAQLAAILPNCQRAIVGEAGGFPLWEFPDRVNPIVRGFLRAH